MTTAAVGPAQTRGFVLSAYATFDYADCIAATSATAFELFRLPLGATVIGGSFACTTVFNSATSDSMTVGDTDVDEYVTAYDLTSTGVSKVLGNLLGIAVAAADRPVNAIWTAVGAVPTTGAGNMLLCYADPSYNTINYEN